GRGLPRLGHDAGFKDGRGVLAEEVVGRDAEVQPAGRLAGGGGADLDHAARLLGQAGALEALALGLLDRNGAAGGKEQRQDQQAAHHVTGGTPEAAKQARAAGRVARLRMFCLVSVPASTPKSAASARTSSMLAACRMHS